MDPLGLSDSTVRAVTRAADVVHTLAPERRALLIRALCELAYADGAAHAGALIASGITARATVEKARAT